MPKSPPSFLPRPLFPFSLVPSFPPVALVSALLGFFFRFHFFCGMGFFEVCGIRTPWRRCFPCTHLFFIVAYWCSSRRLRLDSSFSVPQHSNVAPGCLRRTPFSLIFPPSANRFAWTPLTFAGSRSNVHSPLIRACHSCRSRYSK